MFDPQSEAQIYAEIERLSHELDTLSRPEFRRLASVVPKEMMLARANEIGLELFQQEKIVFQITNEPEVLHEGPRRPVSFELEINHRNLENGSLISRVARRNHGEIEIDNNSFEFKPAPATGLSYLRQGYEYVNALSAGQARSRTNSIHFHVGADFDVKTDEGIISAAKLALAWSVIEPVYLRALPNHRITNHACEPVGIRFAAALGTIPLSKEEITKAFIEAVAPTEEKNVRNLAGDEALGTLQKTFAEEPKPHDRWRMLNLVSLFQRGTAEFRGEHIETDKQGRVGQDTFSQLTEMGTFFSDLVEQAPRQHFQDLQNLVRLQGLDPERAEIYGFLLIEKLSGSETFSRYLADRIQQISTGENRELPIQFKEFLNSRIHPREQTFHSLPIKVEGNWQEAASKFAEAGKIFPPFLETLNREGLLFADQNKNLVFVHTNVDQAESHHRGGSSFVSPSDSPFRVQLTPGTTPVYGPFWFVTEGVRKRIVFSETAVEGLRYLSELKEQGESTSGISVLALNGTREIPQSLTKGYPDLELVVLYTPDQTQDLFLQTVRESFPQTKQYELGSIGNSSPADRSPANQEPDYGIEID